jgi:transposase-like protein
MPVTNAIESLNAKLRRSVRIRGHFPNDEAAMCVFHAMSVTDFTACRSNISRDVGPRFHGMSVQDFTPCRPGFHGGPSR